MKRKSWMLPLLCLLAVGGCGKELTAGGQREGEVSAVATDTDAGASSARYTLIPGGAVQPAAVADVEGIVGMDVAVALVAASGGLVPITDGTVEAEVAVGTSSRVPLSSRAVIEGVYPTVRVTFEEVVAQVEGLSLNGTAFQGTVAVDLGGEPLTVDVHLPVTVREDARSTVVLQLHSLDWLAFAEILPIVGVDAVVSASAFRQAIEVTVE